MPEHATRTAIVTGASGVVGGHLVRRLLQEHDREVICLLRGSRSVRRLKAMLGEPDVARLRIVEADLEDAEAVGRAIAEIGPRDRVDAMHCAGDVSWTKSERLLWPVNVEGTRSFARLVLAVSRDRPRFVFLSTAFIDDGGGPQRNAYEASKLAAENDVLRPLAKQMAVGILRCSLIVGQASDGEIMRFNGLYPLIRLVAFADVPCVIADRSYQVDIIPIDFVCDQVERLLASLDAEAAPRVLIAASGTGALGLPTIVQAVHQSSNRVRVAAGSLPLPAVSIITERQFRFLMNAASSWGMKTRFEKVEQISGLMAGYILHGRTGRPIEIATIDVNPPAPSSYIQRVVDYWIGQHAERIRQVTRIDWLEPKEQR